MSMKNSKWHLRESNPRPSGLLLLLLIQFTMYVISIYLYNVNEPLSHLGYYWHCGTAYRSRLQGSSLTLEEGHYSQWKHFSLCGIWFCGDDKCHLVVNLHCSSAYDANLSVDEPLEVTQEVVLTPAIINFTACLDPYTARLRRILSKILCNFYVTENVCKEGIHVCVLMILLTAICKRYSRTTWRRVAYVKIFYILWNNQQMQLYAVKFIPLLGSLYRFRMFYVYGSVHHNIFYEITNRCSYMQSNLCLCFRAS